MMHEPKNKYSEPEKNFQRQKRKEKDPVMHFYQGIALYKAAGCKVNSSINKCSKMFIQSSTQAEYVYHLTWIYMLKYSNKKLQCKRFITF